MDLETTFKLMLEAMLGKELASLTLQSKDHNYGFNIYRWSILSKTGTIYKDRRKIVIDIHP